MTTSAIDPRRLIRTYLVLMLALSSIWYTLIISAGTLGAKGGLYVLALMWSPGTAALLTRWWHQRNLRGQGWGWGATKWQIAAYLIPLGYATVAYGAVWLTGLGGVGPYKGKFILFATLGLLVSCISALGEELGWRGLLVPELAKVTSFTKTAFISGSIWATWHMPLILFADYNSGTSKPYAVACFAVLVLGISFVFAWLRLKSGSVWTGMLLHASHNLWIQSFFDKVTIDTGRTLWFTTEFGAALALVSVIVAYIVWRQRDALPTSAAVA